MSEPQGTTEKERQRFEPEPTELTEPYWDATRRRELVLQWCTRCARPIYYPRHRCPSCLGDELEWRRASGRGEVYAFTVQHRAAQPGLADRVPYVVALVDLEEGVRVMTNVVGSEPHAVHVGQPVQVTWEELSDGRALPLFEPTSEGAPQ